MKRKTNFLFLLLSICLFLFLYVYTETNLINPVGYFNYHISNFIEYVFLWSSVLFILSLLALKLDVNKYKTWLIVSIVVSVVSIFIAYVIGDGNGAIIDIDVELTTWFFLGPYSFISIIYFIVQFIKNRKANN